MSEYKFIKSDRAQILGFSPSTTTTYKCNKREMANSWLPNSPHQLQNTIISYRTYEYILPPNYYRKWQKVKANIYIYRIWGGFTHSERDNKDELDKMCIFLEIFYLANALCERINDLANLWFSSFQQAIIPVAHNSHYYKCARQRLSGTRSRTICVHIHISDS